MENSHKQVFVVILAAILATSIIIVILPITNSNAQTTCRPSVIIRVGLYNATANSVYEGNVTLDGLTKSGSVNASNSTYPIIDFTMKTRQCYLGHSYVGYINTTNVNLTEFDGRIKNLDQPNKAVVDVTPPG